MLVVGSAFLVMFLWLTAEEHRLEQLDQQAGVHLAGGDLDEALAIWLDLLERKPGDVTLLNRLGIAYTQGKDYERAESYFQQALSADANEPQAYFNMALLAMNRGQSEQAEAILLRLLEVCDWYPQANYHLGYICEKSERLELAKKYYVRELNVNGSCAKAWRRYLALKNDESLAKASGESAAVGAR